MANKNKLRKPLENRLREVETQLKGMREAEEKVFSFEGIKESLEYLDLERIILQNEDRDQIEAIISEIEEQIYTNETEINERNLEY